MTHCLVRGPKAHIPQPGTQRGQIIEANPDPYHKCISNPVPRHPPAPRAGVWVALQKPLEVWLENPHPNAEQLRLRLSALRQRYATVQAKAPPVRGGRRPPGGSP